MRRDKIVLGRINAIGTVLARTAGAFINVDIAMSPKRDVALRGILFDEVVRAQAVRVATSALTPVCMKNHLPVRRRVVASTSIQARIARALVNVHVTVAAPRGGLVTLQYRTLCVVFCNERVVTLAIRKTRNARTSIRVHGNEWIRVRGRLCACTSVLTWTAVALVHIDVAVATERRVLVTLAHGALRRILGDEVIQTYAVGEPSGTRASVCVQ